jgi:hypothetical protein
MVERTVSGKRVRITRLLGHALTPEVQRQLEALLETDEGMYRISLLKWPILYRIVAKSLFGRILRNIQ